jgi:hypothetical protein
MDSARGEESNSAIAPAVDPSGDDNCNQAVLAGVCMGETDQTDRAETGAA